MKRKMFYLMVLLLLGISGYSQLLPDSQYDINVKPIDSDKIKGFTQERLYKAYEVKDSLSNYFKVVEPVSLTDDVKKIAYKGLGVSIDIREQIDSTRLKYKDREILRIVSFISPYPTSYYNITGLRQDSIDRIAHMLRNREYDKPYLTNAYQTCVSYALENIFKYNGFEPYPIFSYKTMVDDVGGLSAICKALFKYDGTVELKNIGEYNIPDKSLILFIDADGLPIHACYFMDNKFWNKNGILPYSSSERLDDFTQYSYRYTNKFEIYTFNEDIFIKKRKR